METLSSYKQMIRPDGKAKVSGELQYLSDLSFPSMLYGKVLRSGYPHAEILSIDTTAAEKIPGVQAVITAADIPGLNGFGIITPDQPVFCEDRVRYVGDAVAAVAADSMTIAEKALSRIYVEYAPLPVIDDPEKAMDEAAILLHPTGNLLHEASHRKGNVAEGFGYCTTIIEETYSVPRQMHTYMETEGGVIVPEADGKLTVYVGTQHGYKDRFQLARILDMKEEDIRIISSPMGGSFGGKDELNIQPYAALLALKTKRPVKIHQTRRESIVSGLKRHPMKITMRTGMDSAGRLQAHQVKILSDTGAYATLGPAILDFAVEHAVGPYIVPHVETEGKAVFTNNGVSGEFRGFGGNQVTFALEGQMDRLAEAAGIDPLELRKINIRGVDDPGPLNHRIAPTNGASAVLEKMVEHVKRKELNVPGNGKLTGSGISISMHGGGLGYGRLDPAGGSLTLKKDGKIEAAFGFEEVGQGILNVIETIGVAELNITTEDLIIIIGDTDKVPSTGSTTASRGTSMVWHAFRRMKEPFQRLITQEASRLTGDPYEELRLGPGGVYKRLSEERLLDFQTIAKHAANGKPLCVTTEFDFPTTSDPVDGGHFLYTFSAAYAQVEVDTCSGQVTVTDLDQIVAAGPVVSLIGYRGQIEGGGIMGLGYALMEDAIMDKGRYVTENLDEYLIPTIKDVPKTMLVEPIQELEFGDEYGPRGVGEIGTVAAAPAIASAVFHATGHWMDRLPISPAAVLGALADRRNKQWI
ncbi:xanthine dehydrogenase subunit D [Bacillus sp. SB49]|uniref:xanthine dehydrogenase subunit D n=1 Tax=Bacillus sp. SB49 TaxID=1071080 RepID=UPI0004173E5A|nr:xanthine dehydrogenase subunit D [Bacillus sp. SB49]QHT47648.1 xanthine dehydrogenase subunit D [Bacillus sp. SB49]